jgi:2-phosphosulfolactate phosphatase
MDAILRVGSSICSKRWRKTMVGVVCEWGPQGAQKIAGRVGAIVVVDVLSFSTCVDVAVSGGAFVYPFAYDHCAAKRLALNVGGEVAGPRGSSTIRFSLSPASLFEIQAGTKLVLPSPNGAAISAACRAAPVLAGCLRNARAVAKRARKLRRRPPLPLSRRVSDGLMAGFGWPSRI